MRPPGISAADSAWINRVAALRANGQERRADGLTAEVVTSAAPQKAAGFTCYLRSLGMHRDADLSLATLSRRLPDEVDVAARTLLDLGCTWDYEQLFSNAGRGAVQQTASLLRLIAARGDDAGAAKLLTASAFQRAAEAGELPELLAALTAADSAGLTIPLLKTAIDGWSQQQVLALALTLDATGDRMSAYGLYVRAGRFLTEQWSADRITALVSRMAGDGATVQADQILDAAVETCVRIPSAIAPLAHSLVAADQAAAARRLVGAVAPSLASVELGSLVEQFNVKGLNDLSVHALTLAAMGRPIADIIGFSDILRGHGFSEQADELVVAAALDHPHDTAMLLDALRATRRRGRTGRLLAALRLAAAVDDPQDAAALIDTVRGSDSADRVLAGLARAGVERRARVANALWCDHAYPDAEALLTTIADLPPSEITSALTLLQEPLDEADGAFEALCIFLLAKPIGQYAEVIGLLHEGAREQLADRMVIRLIDHIPEQALSAARALAQRGLRRACAVLIHRLAIGAAPDDLGRTIRGLGDIRSPEIDTAIAAAFARRTDQHDILFSLRIADLGDLARLCLTRVAAAAPPGHLGALHDDLLTYGAAADLEVLIAGIAARPDMAQVCAALHQTGRHPFAYHIEEARAQRHRS